jgi:hypothetical protein
MTGTNQKLREALQAISHIDDTTNHSVDASAALDRIGQIARQALALPTAEQVDDINVAESFTSVTKTAAPVGERLTLSAEDVHAAFVKHFPKTRISQAWIGFAAEIAEAIAARAALSAQAVPNPWRDAVIEQLESWHIYVPAIHENSPRLAIKALVNIETQAALDPKVSSQAAALAAGAVPDERDKVDAQRYRWLREQNDDDFAFAVVKNPHFDVYESPEELDAAIDAAMRKDKT